MRGLNFDGFIAIDLHAVFPDKVGMAPIARDFVLLEQRLNAAGEGAHDVGFALHHGVEVELDPFDLDAVALQLMAGFLIEFARFEQCLAGNATDAHASAAKQWIAFDTRHVKAQLRGADGSRIATGATANDEQIVLNLFHN